MKQILFQGDSITDAGRSRENDGNKGVGYPTMVAGTMGYTYPNKYSFINRGISGNRVVDLYARIKDDFINLEPDYISILIGVNDVWHEVARKNGVDAVKFEKIYSMLIEETLEALPNVKIMVLEPFVLRASETDDEWDTFSSEVEKRQIAARSVADMFALTFVPLQDKFDKLLEKAPASYWLVDGVHPTSAGHALIAEQWVEAFNIMNV